MNRRYSNYLLHAKIDAMGRYLNLDKYIDGEKNSLKDISSYFKINKWAYKHFHSQDGFMHFRISPTGVFSDEDVYFQPDVVSDFINDGDSVLELGFGNGANLLYLARCHPQASFTGVDLQRLEAKNVPTNVATIQADYSSLSQIADNSVDVAYAFETIVHNTDKEKIYREVCRVLKPGGVMIVYDYALCAPFDTFDEHTRKAIALISKGGAAAMIESTEELNSHYIASGLNIERIRDYSVEVMPDLKRLERKGAKIMERPWLARLMFALLPDQFVTNIILGYLGYDSCKAGVITYKEWVLRK
ncbi:MAG: class I SAM-dependent methyltransferase [Prevotella sp.]|nr:class I SAM-dependent methyltransferase [Prevotella sp.]